MVAASEFASRLVAVLARAAASTSNQLSVATVLGLALASLLPLGAPSPATRQASPAAVDSAGPAELARASLAPVRETPPPPDPSAAEDRASASILQVVARRSRGRRKPQPESESGAFGKAGAGVTAEKTPADAKTATPQAEPPPPDVWSDAEIISALRDCLERLAPLGAEIEIAQPVKKERCGAAAPVVLKRMGSGADRIEFRPGPMLNCAMVARLHTWIEDTLQPAARELLGSPVARVRNASGYVCRNRMGTVADSDRLSEHALANAIDISGFVTADGRAIDVLKTWGPTVRDIREQQERAAEAAEQAEAVAEQAEREAAEAARAVAKAEKGAKRESAKAEAARRKREAERKREEAQEKEAEWRKSLLRTAERQKLGRSSDARVVPVTSSVTNNEQRKSAEAAFLRRLHKGACGTFGTVLGPEANEAHRNHFHFDLVARKRRAYCR